MKILVTGAAGFIGCFVSKKLVENGHTVVGLDNINDYYDVQLKYDRLALLGIGENGAEGYGNLTRSEKIRSFAFLRMNLEDRENLPILFANEKFDLVCNLAAQAGVRHSLKKPETYIDSNIVGFLNILEACRANDISHLVYASSSSVYGQSTNIPYKTNTCLENPISLYAATKKSNELMAHTYSHLFDLATTGLRFFTVYGPWGRPDMAMTMFTKAIINDDPVKVFNYGNLSRDFTYIRDIVEGVVKVIEKKSSDKQLYNIYNIGNNKSVKLLDFIRAIESCLGKKAKIKMLPMQPGDVADTWADIDNFANDFNYRPKTDIQKGIKEYIKWFKEYYHY